MDRIVVMAFQSIDVHYIAGSRHISHLSVGIWSTSSFIFDWASRPVADWLAAGAVAADEAAAAEAFLSASEMACACANTYRRPSECSLIDGSEGGGWMDGSIKCMHACMYVYGADQ